MLVLLQRTRKVSWTIGRFHRFSLITEETAFRRHQFTPITHWQKWQLHHIFLHHHHSWTQGDIADITPEQITTAQTDDLGKRLPNTLTFFSQSQMCEVSFLYCGFHVLHVRRHWVESSRSSEDVHVFWSHRSLHVWHFFLAQMSTSKLCFASYPGKFCVLATCEGSFGALARSFSLPQNIPFPQNWKWSPISGTAAKETACLRETTALTSKYKLDCEFQVKLEHSALLKVQCLFLWQ